MATSPLRADMATNVSWTFTDLDAGTYLLDYDLTFDKTVDDARISCSLGYADLGRIIPAQGYSASTTRSVVGSVLVTYDGVHKPQLGCGAQSGTIQIARPDFFSASVVLTRVDAVADAAVTTETSNPE